MRLLLHNESQLHAWWIGGEHPSRFFAALIGQFLYSVGLASLVPVAGFCILVAGEAVRLFRQWLARDEIPVLKEQHLKKNVSSRLMPRQSQRQAARWPN